MGLRRASAWVREHPFLVDLTLTALLWFFLLVTAGLMGSPLELLLIATVQVAPLAWRRSEPLAAAVVIAIGCLAQVLLSNQPSVSNVAVLLIVYSAAVHAEAKWQSLTVLGMGLTGALVAAVDWSFAYTGAPRLDQLLLIAPVLLLLAMSVLVAWVLGDVVRRRRAVVARLREQNEALARDQAQRAALAASGERASIAREMHDIVAHSLSVVVVQADGGAYTARAALAQGGEADRGALERAAQTLETLAATAREALTDTRRLVGVLRESGSTAEYAPAQGLGQLDELVHRLRDSGVPVELTVRGETQDLPRDLDLAAYRVVQESLTNVLKHAGPGARAVVDVLRTPAVLLVRVTDNGQGPRADDGHGHGIIGMSERVEVLGGTLYAGGRTQGGFEVVASVPLERDGEQHEERSAS